MTKEEIKKALELCSKDEDCEKCPYFISNKYFHCLWAVQEDSLALITEQEKEIKNQRQIIENLNGLIDYADEEIRRLKAEVKQAKIDVLKELKTRHDYAIKNMGYPWDISQQIDKLIKEIENAEDKSCNGHRASK